MDPQSAGDNRRKHPRTELSLLVQFRCDSFEEFIADYATNLSMGGMFIRTAEPRDLGELVYLQFYLRDGAKLVEGLGRVVHVNPANDPARTPGMGVEFVGFDEDSMALVEEICGGAAPRAASKN